MAGAFDDLIPRGGATPVNAFADLVPAPRGNIADAAMQGLTLGFSDELGGLIRGAGNVLQGGEFGPAYAEGRDSIRADVEDYQKRHPYLSTAAEVAGSVPTALLPVGGAARGATLAARAMRSGLAGGALGAVAGVGHGDDTLAGRTVSGTTGAVLGAAGGAVAPAVGRGVARIANLLRGGRSSGFEAAELAGRALTDDAMTPADARAALADLGPDAIIADLGPNLQRQAGALASVPGRGQEIVRDAILARSRGANQRIIGELNSSLGPAEIPSHIEAGIRASQRALAPEYQAALANARAVDTRDIAFLLDSHAVNLRGPAQAAVRGVRQMLNVAGGDVLDPNPGTLLQTRQAIDGMLNGETDRNVVRALSDARQRIDEALTDAVPGIKAVDAKYAELARQSEALQRGQTVLDSGRDAPRPVELAEEVVRGAVPRGEQVGPSAVPLRMAQGARAEIERIIGTNTNDVVALQKLIKGEGSWNRDRLASLFGPDRADRIIRVLDRERQFAETTNTVTRNSETAARQAAQREVAPATSGRGDAGMIRSALNLNFGDSVARVADILRRSSAGAREAARNEELARLLMSRQAPQTTFPVPLPGGGNASATVTPPNPAIDAIVRALAQRGGLERIERGTTGALQLGSRLGVPLLVQQLPR
jgi:hypothetical protein